MKNYYKILGIPVDAKKEEIKKAWQTLSEKFHPSKQQGDKRAFREIREAYDTLYFEEKRAVYDQVYQAEIARQPSVKKILKVAKLKWPLLKNFLAMSKPKKKRLVFLAVGAVLLLLLCFGVWLFFEKKQEKVQDFRQEGMAKFSQGAFQEASDLLEKGGEEEKNPEVLLKLGAAYYNQRKYDEAVRIYEKIIANDEENAMALNSLANAYRDKKDSEKAISAYEKAIKINPLSPLAYSNLAILLMDGGQVEDAKNVIKAGLASIPDSQELKNIKTYLEK